MNDNTPNKLNSNPRRFRSALSALTIPLGMFGFNTAVQAHPTDAGHAVTGRRKSKRSRVKNKDRDWAVDIREMRKKKKLKNPNTDRRDAKLHAARRLHSNFIAADKQHIAHNPGDQPMGWSNETPMGVLKFVENHRRKHQVATAPTVE